MVSSASPKPIPRWILWIAGIAALGMAMYGLRGVLTPVFFAFLIAYALSPIVDRLEGRRVPRAAGATVVLVGAPLLVTIGLLFAAPRVAQDIGAFASVIPERLDALLEGAAPWFEERGIALPRSTSQLVGQSDIDMQGMAERIATPIAQVVRWLVGGTASLFGAIAGVILIPVLAFYLLYDFHRIVEGARDLVPHAHREAVVGSAREIDDMLGQFLRGQLTVMVILAVLYAIAYSLAGVRLALLIGLVAGLVSFIPYVGGATALVLALLMVALDWQGPGQLLGVVIAYTAIQLLEGFVITPVILGDKVGLSSLWVLLALMVGGELFGFLGVLLAVPAAAVAKIFVAKGIDRYKKSNFFLKERGVS